MTSILQYHKWGTLETENKYNFCHLNFRREIYELFSLVLNDSTYQSLTYHPFIILTNPTIVPTLLSTATDMSSQTDQTLKWQFISVFDDEYLHALRNTHISYFSVTTQ